MQVSNFTHAMCLIGFMKSTFIIAILAIVNFIFFVSYILVNPELKSYELTDTYKLADNETKEGKGSTYTIAISFLKEFYTLVFEMVSIGLFLFSNNPIFDRLKYIYILVLPILYTRIKQLSEKKGFVESDIIKEKINSNTLWQIIYGLGYLILPISFIIFAKYQGGNLFGLGYLYVGTFGYVLSKILNLIKPNSSFSSESFWGSILEAIAYGCLGGWLWFSPIFTIAINVLFSNKMMIPLYLITFTVIILGAVPYLYGKYKQIGR